MARLVPAFAISLALGSGALAQSSGVALPETGGPIPG